MVNALTIDVEDYHSIVSRDWCGEDMLPTRKVVENTTRLLDHFAQRKILGTFYILGEVAQAFPDLIRKIAAPGHELGVHGFYHRQVFKLDAESFRKEVADAKALIEDISGRQVLGHRAPAFSIMPKTEWALEVLAEAGFRYDSSIFPIKGRRYGWPGFRTDIHEITFPSGRKIIEAPLSTVQMLGRRWPACGGGYIRHFPKFVSRWAMRRVARERPAILYMHPYEIETDAGPVNTSGISAKAARRLRRMHWLQLRNRASVEDKVVSLISQFEFAPLARIIEQQLGLELSPAA
ncbi:MAG TPA: polysaccharide deacetylase family protein [Phycisphaerae bacterium]|nr:polysaccharide deacetylase family protein [Phycisphaerae bacterium]